MQKRQPEDWRHRPQKVNESNTELGLAIIVKRQLIGMRTNIHGDYFSIQLVGNPVLNEVLIKDTAHGQKVMIAF